MNDITFKPEPEKTTDKVSTNLIGKSVARPNARRLLEGRGVYLDDIELPCLAHVVYLRSPHAHARILGMDLEAARSMPGVIALVDGHQIAEVCTPWVATL